MSARSSIIRLDTFRSFWTSPTILVWQSCNVEIQEFLIQGGETVRGRVDLNVTQPIAGVKGIMVKWKGFEKTFIEDHYTTSDGNGHTQRTLHPNMASVTAELQIV